MSLAPDVMVVRDIYMRHTAGNGSSYVAQHRVWDAERFITARANDAASSAAKASALKEPAKHRAVQITEEQFKKERTK